MSTRPETLAPPAAPRGSAGASPSARGPARTGGSGLTKRWHGMPVWVWLVGAGVGGYLIWTKVLHKSSTATTTPAPATTTPATPPTTTTGPVPGSGPIPTTPGGPPLGTTPPTTPGTDLLRTAKPIPMVPYNPTPTKPTGPTPRKAAATANAAVKRANADAAAAAARANAAVARANQDAAAAAKRAQASIAHSNALAAAARNRATAHHVATKHVRSTGKKPASHVITSATGRIHRRRG